MNRRWVILSLFIIILVAAFFLLRDDEIKKYHVELPFNVAIDIEMVYHVDEIHYRVQMKPRKGLIPDDYLIGLDFHESTLFYKLKKRLEDKDSNFAFQKNQNQKVLDFLEKEGHNPYTRDDPTPNERTIEDIRAYEHEQHIWFSIELLDKNGFELDFFFINNPSRNSGYDIQDIKGKFPNITWAGTTEIDKWIFEESNQINFKYLIDPDDEYIDFEETGEGWARVAKAASLKVSRKWITW